MGLIWGLFLFFGTFLGDVWSAPAWVQTEPLCFVLSGTQFDPEKAFEDSPFLQRNPAVVAGSTCITLNSWAEIDAYLNKSPRTAGQRLVIFQLGHGSSGGAVSLNGGKATPDSQLTFMRKWAATRKVAVLTESCFSGDFLAHLPDVQKNPASPWSEQEVRNLCVVGSSTPGAVSQGGLVEPQQLCAGCSLESVFLNADQGLVSSFPWEGSQLYTLLFDVPRGLQRGEDAFFASPIRGLESGQAVFSGYGRFAVKAAEACDSSELVMRLDQLLTLDAKIIAIEAEKSAVVSAIERTLRNRRHSHLLPLDSCGGVLLDRIYQYPENGRFEDWTWGQVAQWILKIERSVAPGCLGTQVVEQLKAIVLPMDALAESAVTRLIERVQEIRNLRLRRLQLLNQGAAGQRCRLADFFLRIGTDLGNLASQEEHPDRWWTDEHGNSLLRSNRQLYAAMREWIRTERFQATAQDRLRREACQSFVF